MPVPAALVLVITPPAARVRVPEPVMVAALPALLTTTEPVEVTLAVEPPVTIRPPTLVKAPPRFSVPPPLTVREPVPDTLPSKVCVSAAPVV